MNLPALIDAAVPLVGGLAVTVLGFSRRPGAAADAKRTLLHRLRWLGPAVLVFGMWRFSLALSADPTRVDARDIAAALRKKLAPPSMVDEITRIDGIGSVGQHVIVRATITRPPAGEPERAALLDQAFRQTRIKLCRNHPTDSWLEQGIGFEYEYTMDGKTYPPVIVIQRDCE
jgi:hypothetical protein